MNTPITWGELMKVVLFLLGAGVLFYLLLAVANLVGILKNLNKMLEKNRPHIDSSLKKLPEITENVAKVSDIVKDEMENIQKVMGNVGKISDSAKDAVEMIKKDIVVKAKNILDLIDWIKKLFQDKGGKKKEIVYNYKYKPSDETVEEKVSKEDDDQKQEEDSTCKADPKVEEEPQEVEVEQGAGI